MFWGDSSHALVPRLLARLETKKDKKVYIFLARLRICEYNKKCLYSEKEIAIFIILLVTGKLQCLAK